MINNETKVIIGDNSNAHLGKCIRIIGTNKRLSASVGDYIVVALPHRHLIRRLLTKNIYLGLIVLIKKNVKRSQGYYIKSNLNKIVLLSEQGKLVGNLIHGGLFQESINYGLGKMITLAKGVI